MNLPEMFKSRMQLLLGDAYDEFLQGYELPLRRGLRVNTSKISVKRFCELFPHPLTPSPFSQNCFYVDADFKAGSDPLHHCGAYYMQEPSASSAVSVLNPTADEWVLDLCAAPGGKSTQIAATLNGKGLLWSNEYVLSRARILQQNLERCGVRNAVISNKDTGPLCDHLQCLFDAVLVDAPCSGEGMFRKEPQALTEWSLENVLLCAERQKEILNNAAKTVKPNGRLVYSTCTFAPEENECVVADFLANHSDFELIKIDVDWGCPGFSVDVIRQFCPSVAIDIDLTKCRRILPQHGGEGHFIALFHRQGETITTVDSHSQARTDANAKAASELYSSCFSDEPTGQFWTSGEMVRVIPNNLPDGHSLGVLSAGYAVATICKNRLEPCHSAFISANKDACRLALDFEPNDPLLLSYLHGEEIPCTDLKGWVAVCVAGIPVGFGKASGGRLKNRYPKGLRLI